MHFLKVPKMRLKSVLYFNGAIYWWFIETLILSDTTVSLTWFFFQAAENSGRKIKVIAVEKNTNAIVTLLTQKDEMWGEKVQVVSSDMRDFKSSQLKADIVVSELLGKNNCLSEYKHNNCVIFFRTLR